MYWQQSDLIQQLLRRARVGVVSDFDGTLSPIMPDRTKPVITPRNKQVLAALAQKLPLVAAVSGRMVEDLRSRVGLPELVYVGSHGLEWWVDEKVVPVPEAAAYHPIIQKVIGQLTLADGMAIDDKGATVSIHYRNTSDPDAIFRQYDPIIRRLATENGLNYFTGKMIFELRPPIAINKGTVLQDLINNYRLDGVVFLGDDVTDADGLEKAQHLRQAGSCFAIGLAVESDDMPDVVRDHADLLATGVPDVEAFLTYLLDSLT